MPAAKGSVGAGQGLLSSQSDQLATKQEAELVLELRRELEPELAAAPQYPELVGDIRLLRTLRGFDHNLPEAAKAFRHHLEVRKRYGLNEVRERLMAGWGARLWELKLEDLPNGELICSYMPEVLIFAVAKSGDPVNLGWWGRGRPADFIRQVPGWQTRFLEYFLHAVEAKSLLLDQASRTQGRLVHFTSVFDLKDWSMLRNSDRAWTKFCTEVTGPAGQTYHEINSRFITIHTTAMAKVAYNMLKPLLPKRVTQKVFLLGSDLRSSPELRSVLDDEALALLEQGAGGAGPRRRTGQALLRPAGAFALRLEVPPGGGLRWHFGVERGGCWGRLATCGVRFSVARHEGDGGDSTFIEGLEPQLLQAGGSRGCLQLPDGRPDVGSSLELRWENSHSMFLSRRLRYEVEVEHPLAAAKPTKAPGRTPYHHLLVLLLSVCLLCVSAAMRRA